MGRFMQRSTFGRRFGWGVFGFIAGASLAYFFDQRRGPARRARWRDQTTSGARHTAQRLQRRSHDLKNRLRGVYLETRGRLQEETVPDAILEERVRSQLGHHASHPGLVKVRAEDGHLVLTGAILDTECDDLVSRLESVRGVKSIESQLEVYGSVKELDRYSGRQGRQTNVPATWEVPSPS